MVGTPTQVYWNEFGHNPQRRNAHSADPCALYTSCPATQVVAHHGRSDAAIDGDDPLERQNLSLRSIGE